jgi:deazaflavin-dependent oxidoreductase (nitroreductase family)
MSAQTTSRRAGPPRWAERAFDPVAKLLAGHRWFPLWAVLHHRGRRSGTEYAIPVAVIPTVSDDIFLIGLPWGERTNWARNVLAAGGASLDWKGRRYAASSPRIVGREVAVAQTRHRLLRRVVGSGRFPAFMELQRGPATSV